MAQLPKRLCLAEKNASPKKRRSFGVANVEILEEIWMNVKDLEISEGQTKQFSDNCIWFTWKWYHMGSFAVFYIQKCLMFIHFPIRTIWIHFFRTLPEVFSKSPGRDVRWIFTIRPEMLGTFGKPGKYGAQSVGFAPTTHDHPWKLFRESPRKTKRTFPTPFYYL